MGRGRTTAVMPSTCTEGAVHGQVGVEDRQAQRAEPGRPFHAADLPHHAVVEGDLPRGRRLLSVVEHQRHELPVLILEAARAASLPTNSCPVRSMKGPSPTS